MRISPNEVAHVMQVCFTAYSIDPTTNSTTVPVAAAATVQVISKQPTHNTRHITLGIESTFAGNVIIRKYFNAGNNFADEIVAIGIGTTVVTTSSPLEEAEIRIQSGGAAGTVIVTMMARP